MQQLVRLVLPILAVATAASAQERGFAVDTDTEILAHAFGPAAADETIVVIHGGPGLSHDYLLPLAALADERRSVVFYDQRGAGLSGSASDLGLDAQVLDLDAVIRRTGATRVHLLGHSWGTVIALAYAVAHPDRVASLVLVGMGAPSADADRRSFGPAFAARKSQLLKQRLVPRARPLPEGGDCMAGFSSTLPVHFADPRHPAALRRLPGTYRCGAYGRTVAAAGAWDFRGDLPSLDVPILFVIGDADANLAGLPETTRLVPRGITAKLVDCGHFPFLECPERFFPAVERFLSAF